MDMFKATNLGQFLLYLYLYRHGYFEAFITYHSIAVRILLHAELHTKMFDFPRLLLHWFIKKTYSVLYDENHVSYNVHNLVHISEDVKKIEAGNNFSAFKYQNYLKKHSTTM